MVSQRDIAYAQIREMIFHMELLPGDRVPELQIAARLNLSRTPIHDALRCLEAEGLVLISHNRGASVKQFSEEEIREIGAIRLAQDILSAELASYYGSASDFEALMRLADACEAAAQSGDIYGRIQLDMDFHTRIAAISGNARLLEQQRQLYQQIHLIQISKYTDISQSLIQINHHKPLVRAIQAGDLKRVRSLIYQHIKDFFRLDAFLLRCYDMEETT